MRRDTRGEAQTGPAAAAAPPGSPDERLAATYDYLLPPRLIAQEPASPRDASTLVVAGGRSGRVEFALFREIGRFLRAGDLLLFNDTRVIPARLAGRRESGGRVEALVVGPFDGDTADLIATKSGRLRVGETLTFAAGALRAVIVGKRAKGAGDPATLVSARFALPEGAPDLARALWRFGETPLPPYIRRVEGDARGPADRERYQSLLAAVDGSVAAPTASLHFTRELLDRLEAADVRRATITLHVGPGTFLPLAAERLDDHRMHAEFFRVPDAAARAVRQTRAAGGRVVAVGTTALRAVETAAARWEEGTPPRERERDANVEGWTDLFVRPGFQFRVVDGLLTNFHLPRSTLLVLASAFFGREALLALYREAVEKGLRFYSYGDATLLWRPAGGPPAG